MVVSAELIQSNSFVFANASKFAVVLSIPPSSFISTPGSLFLLAFIHSFNFLSVINWLGRGGSVLSIASQ